MNKKHINESVTDDSEFKPIHISAWKMILRASPEAREQMAVRGTAERRKVKREVMFYLHEPATRQYMDQPIENIVDDYLEQAKLTSIKPIEPGHIISEEEAEYIELVHRRTQVITIQKV